MLAMQSALGEKLAGAAGKSTLDQLGSLLTLSQVWPL
jgi:hypothetical protein